MRISIDHVARHNPDSETRRRTAQWINIMLTPIFDRCDGVHWEFHVDETSDEIWMING